MEIQRINGRFYLRDAGVEVGEAKNEADAKLWSRARDLRDMVAKLIPLVPDNPYMMGSVPHPLTREAKKLLDETQ